MKRKYSLRDVLAAVPHGPARDAFLRKVSALDPEDQLYPQKLAVAFDTYASAVIDAGMEDLSRRLRRASKLPLRTGKKIR